MRTHPAADRVSSPEIASVRRDTRVETTRRLGSTLRQAVVRELVWPTLFAIGGITTLVLAADLIGYSDLVINRGFATTDVAWIAVYRLLPMLARAIPFAVLVGVLVGLGRLGADREIVALESCGVSSRTLVAPVAWFAAAFAALGIALATVAVPWANRSLDESLRAFVVGEGGTPLRSGQVQRLGDWRLVAREVSPRGDVLRGVAMRAPSIGGTLFAEQASLSSRGGERTLAIEHGVVLVTLGGAPTLLRFDRMRQVLEAPPPGSTLESWAAAADVPTLLAAASDAGASTRQREAVQELHQRVALPLGALVFAVLGVALAIARARPSRSSGAALALGAIVVYYGLLQLGNGLARAQTFPIGLAVWLPDLALAGVAAALLAAVPARRRGAARSRARGGWRAGWSRRPHRFVLDRYLLRNFLELLLVCFGALLVAYFIIDLLDNLKWFTKYRSSPDEVLRFYAARLPLLASRVVPMALLVASALTLSLLGATGELVGMRACGIPTSRIIAPVLVACALAAIAYHPLTNDLVPRASLEASRIKQTEIKGQGGAQVSVWSLSDDRLLEAERLDPMAGTATGVVLYELGPDGLPRFRTDAPHALHVGDGNWSLEDPSRYAIDAQGIHPVAAPQIAHLGHDAVVEVEGDHLSVGALRREIDRLESRGFDPTAFRVDLAIKLAAPLACLLLPALALLFAAGGPPFPTPMQTLVASAAAAGGWILLSAVGASLGYGGAVSPWIAGFGPVAVMGTAAAALAGRVRGRARGA